MSLSWFKLYKYREMRDISKWQLQLLLSDGRLGVGISTIAFKSEKDCLIIINDELSGQTNRIKFHSVGCVSIIHYLVSHITTIGEIIKIKTFRIDKREGNVSINR